MSVFTPIRDQRQATVFATAMVAAVVAPIVNQFRQSPRDSFPFSHYPMFSARRGETLGLAFVRGVRTDGSYEPLDSRLVARGGMNQERKQLAAAARRRTLARQAAQRTARRLAKRNLRPEVVAVEVVRGHFPLAAYFDPGPNECRVEEVRGFAVVPGRDGDHLAPPLTSSGNCAPTPPGPPRRRPFVQPSPSAGLAVANEGGGR
ncbi:MAG: hypothetical protein ACFCVC_19560 [Acidimicrobiia bacterium]